MTVGFRHGALCDPYEKQANEQGFTLGDKATPLQECGDGLLYAKLCGCLTDSEYDRALSRLQKKLVEALRRV